MTPAALKKAFKSYLKERGLVEKKLTPETGFAAMCDFYSTVKFDWAAPDEDDGDMLLFQYGSYDWGEGKNFELNLTRQVMQASDDDDEKIFQLGLTFAYESGPFAKIKSFNQWSSDSEDLEEFQEMIKASKGFVAASKASPTKIKIDAETAG